MKNLVVRRATPDARNLVLQLIRQHQTGLTVQELYKQTMDYQEKNFKLESTPEEPERDYLIPSMRYVVAPSRSVPECLLTRTLRTQVPEEGRPPRAGRVGES